MTAIDVKNNQERVINNKIDRDLLARKHKQRNKKLEDNIIEYLSYQVSPQNAMRILNSAKINLKMKINRREQMK